jgi:hypothetical protein
MREAKPVVQHAHLDILNKMQSWGDGGAIHTDSGVSLREWSCCMKAMLPQGLSLVAIRDAAARPWLCHHYPAHRDLPAPGLVASALQQAWLCCQ